MSVIAELFAKFGLDTDARSFAKGQLAADALKGALGAVAAMAARVTDVLIESTLGVIDHADALHDLSDKTGVSTQALQELGYAAAFGDISLETLASSMGILSKNMVGALEGSVELKKAFKAVGIETKDLVDGNGNLKSVDEVFTMLADSFSKMPASAARNTAAMRIFGKSGSELMPLLLQGSKGIARMRTEFEELHGSFSDDFVNRAGEFNDNVDRLKVAWSGVQSEVAMAVLPALQEAVGAVVAWVRANKELIRTRVREYVEGFVETVTNVYRAVEKWVERSGGLNGVLEQLAHWLKIVSVYMVVKEILSFTRALYGAALGVKALGLAIAANPIGLLITLVALLAATVYANWDDIKEYTGDLWRYIKEFATDVGEAFSTFGSDLYAIFVQPFVDAGTWIKATVTDLWNWVEAKYEAIVNKLAEINAALNPFAEGTGADGGLKRTGRGVAIGTGSADPTVLDPLSSGGYTMTAVNSPTVNIYQFKDETDSDFAQRQAKVQEKMGKRFLREAGAGIL